MSTNNPAGRLLALLTAAADLHHNTQAIEAWRKILDLPGVPGVELLERIGLVFALPNHIQNAVLKQEDHKDDHALLLDWQPKVERAFVVLQLAGTWGEFKNNVTGEVLRSLKHCNAVLRRAAPETELAKEQLEDMLTAARTLHTQVTDSDLDADLKLFLLTHLREIEKAIENYQILGAPGISRAANDAIGVVLVKSSQGFLTRLGQSPVAQSALRFIRRVAFVAQLGANVIKITDGGMTAVQWYLDASSEVDLPPLPDPPQLLIDLPKLPKKP
jgi:hypothetical protein